MNNKTTYNKNWISPKMLAYDLSLSYKTIMKFIKDGNLKAYKLGRHYKINPDDVQSFINNHQAFLESSKS